MARAPDSCACGSCPSNSGNCEVRCLIVGAYALARHGPPRATGALDVWIDPTPTNAARVMHALAEFGAPLDDVREDDVSRPGIVFQIGGLDAFIRNKRATGRTKDLGDIEGL
jgi:hypothetical protein